MNADEQYQSFYAMTWQFYEENILKNGKGRFLWIVCAYVR
jgi:hypothetical protein